jgi:hypothetical protein
MNEKDRRKSAEETFSPVDKVWSDEARAAALESRRSHAAVMPERKPTGPPGAPPTADQRANEMFRPKAPKSDPFAGANRDPDGKWKPPASARYARYAGDPAREGSAAEERLFRPAASMPGAKRPRRVVPT